MVKKKKKKKRPQFNIWLEATKKFGPALLWHNPSHAKNHKNKSS